MTKTEQVEVVRENINLEKEFLDYQIKKRNKASKKSIETKQSKGYNKFGKFAFRNLKF